MPDVGDRDHQVFGKSAGAVDADAAGGVAQMPSARQTVPAAAADQMPFAADQFAEFHVVDVAADGGDMADEFVPDHHRGFDGLLRPFIPVVDVYVGAADGGFGDFDQDVVDAVFGHRHIGQGQPLLRGGFY